MLFSVMCISSLKSVNVPLEDSLSTFSFLFNFHSVEQLQHMHSGLQQQLLGGKTIRRNRGSVGSLDGGRAFNDAMGWIAQQKVSPWFPKSHLKVWHAGISLEDAWGGVWVFVMHLGVADSGVSVINRDSFLGCQILPNPTQPNPPHSGNIWRSGKWV